MGDEFLFVDGRERVEVELDPADYDTNPIRFKKTRDQTVVECRMLLALEDEPKKLVFRSHEEFVTWATEEGRAEELAGLLPAAPSAGAPRGASPTAGPAILTLEQRVELLEIRLAPLPAGPANPTLEQRVELLESRLEPLPTERATPTLEQRVEVLETRLAKRVADEILREVEKLAQERGLEIDSLELFELATQGDDDTPPVSQTLWFYPLIGCRGQFWPVTNYVGNLGGVMPFAPLSARSTGRTRIWDVNYADPKIPSPLPVTSSQFGTTQWDSFVFTPRAADSI
jgi:hypothetical protein